MDTAWENLLYLEPSPVIPWALPQDLFGERLLQPQVPGDN